MGPNKGRVIGGVAEQQIKLDLTEGDGTWPVTMGLLDTTCGRCRLASSLCGQLLARGLASGGLACCLLGTSHFEIDTKFGAILNL